MLDATLQRRLNKARSLLKEGRYGDAILALDGVTGPTSEPAELAEYHLLQAEAQHRLGDYGETHVDKAIAILKDTNDNKQFAIAKAIKARLRIAKGKHRDAKELLNEAYVSFLRSGDLREAAGTLNRLALVTFQIGEIASAVSAIQHAVELYHSADDPSSAQSVSINLASIYFMCGRFRNALNIYHGCLDLLSSMDQQSAYRFYLSHSMATALKGDIKSALKLISKTTAFPDDFKREKAQYYEYLGWIYNLDGQFEKAEKTLKKGIEISMKLAPESALISQTKRLLADAYVGLGKFKAAEKTAKGALMVAEKINERAEIAGCYRVFARVEQNRGDKAKARNWYKKAMDIFAMIDYRYELAVTRYLAATSGMYENGEQTAMLYLAREYFELEDLVYYVDKIEGKLAGLRRPKALVSRPDEQRPVFIASDEKTRRVVELAENVAESDMTVLLTGPTGTGKDQLARYIHFFSGRKGRFVTVNSAAIPGSMVESELFGCRKGAYTGADHDRPGLFEEADGGTFYLNEIADSTPEFQAKLLEVIETKTVRPLGGTGQKRVDIRIIAATNHDLEKRIRERQFRVDLFHRLNVIPIFLPPIEQRRADIRQLAAFFLEQNGLCLDGREGRENLNRLFALLTRRSWPGNVRELKGEIDRLHFLAGGDIEKMIDYLQSGTLTEREELLRALRQTGWNRRKAAQLLGISEGAVRYRMKRQGISGK